MSLALPAREPLVSSLPRHAERVADLLPCGVGVAGDAADLLVDDLRHLSEGRQGVEVGGDVCVPTVGDVGVDRSEVAEPVVDAVAELDEVCAISHVSTMDDRSERVNQG